MESLSSWSNPGLDTLFLALASAIEISFFCGAVVFCQTHYQKICLSLHKCVGRLSAWLRQCGSDEDTKLVTEVRRLQLRMAHTFLNVLAGIGNGITLIYQSNIWRQRQRWMPTEFILFMLPISAYATLHLFCPNQVVTRRTVNFCYGLGMTCGILALSPLGSPALASGNLSLSLAYTAFFRLPSVTLATRTSLVLFLNLLSLVLTLMRAFSEGFPRNLNAGTPLWVEGLSCVVVTLISISLQQWLRGAASQRLHNQKVKAELSAATSLLRLTCDAVIELGEDLKLTSHSSELAAVLLRDRPGASLEGVPLTDFMPPAEAARAAEILGRGEVDGTISANVFHTRLVDTYSSRFRTEVFQVRYSKIDGGVRHLIGLRDFTDQLSLAGRNATDEIPEPSSRSSRQRHPQDASESPPQLTLLELNLQDMVVNSASASLTQMVGRSLEEVFTSDGVELFRNAKRELAALEEQEALHETTLYFGSLGLRLGDSESVQISGTMEPIWSRKEGLRLVLCFQMSPASTGSAMPERAAAAAIPAMSAPQEPLRTPIAL